MSQTTIRMLDTVEDTNEHLQFDADGTPKMNGGTVVLQTRTDALALGGVYTLPAWQANALIEKGFAEPV